MTLGALPHHDSKAPGADSQLSDSTLWGVIPGGQAIQHHPRIRNSQESYLYIFFHIYLFMFLYLNKHLNIYVYIYICACVYMYLLIYL